MQFSTEQLERLPWFAMIDATRGRDDEVVTILPSDVYPLYLQHLKLEESPYGMTIVRRVIEEQLIRALIKMQVVRYTGPNQYDVLSEPLWSEEARVLLAEYLPDSTVGLRHANTANEILHIRFLKQENWDIRKKQPDSNPERTEESAQRDWQKFFFPKPLPSPLCGVDHVER